MGRFLMIHFSTWMSQHWRGWLVFWVVSGLTDAAFNSPAPMLFWVLFWLIYEAGGKDESHDDLIYGRIFTEEIEDHPRFWGTIEK